MRFNRLYLLSVLLSAVLPALFCSRSDVVTGAGGSVVKDFDPNLTDLGSSFKTVTLIDTAAADTAFSLPETPDPLFGTFIADNVLIGLSDDGDTLAAHFQYTIAGNASYVDDDSLIGAYIYFRAADGDSVPSGAAAITLYRSEALRGFAPVNSADKNNDTAGVFSPSGGDTCSLQIRDDLAKSIFDARASRDTNRYETFAFSVVDYAGPLFKIDKPYIVVERRRKECCPESEWVESDTIRGPVARYSPFENAEAAVIRAPEPYSSQLTQRTAVFKVNAGKILDELSRRSGLSGGNSELLNAVITVRYNETNTNDSSVSRAKLLSRNPDYFKALVLDTLLREDIDTLSDSSAHLLRRRFKDIGGTTKLETSYNAVSFKTELRNVIRKRNPGEPAYIYVYLRATTERSTIWWCRPTITYPPSIPSVTVETVFTPHSLHRGNDINQ